jgi:transposase
MNEQLRNEIVHSFICGQSQREIARRLHVSRNTVKSIVDHFYHAREGNNAPDDALATKRNKQQTVLDSYDSRIKELLVRFPNITVVEVQRRLVELGCTASYTVIRLRVRELRCSAARGELANVNAPGAVARVAFRPLNVDVSGKRQAVFLFMYQMLHSGRSYLHLVAYADLATTIFEHLCAFRTIGGPAASIEYDQVFAISKVNGDPAASFNSTFLRFASHYGFLPTVNTTPRIEADEIADRLNSVLQRSDGFRSLDHANDALWQLASADASFHNWSEVVNDPSLVECESDLIPLPSRSWQG